MTPAAVATVEFTFDDLMFVLEGASRAGAIEVRGKGTVTRCPQCREDVPLFEFLAPFLERFVWFPGKPAAHRRSCFEARSKEIEELVRVSDIDLWDR